MGLHKFTVVKGATSQIVHVQAYNSSVTTDAGLTGLVFNAASLQAYYMRDGDTGPTVITLATATLGTWTSGGFRLVDDTNAPGLIEFGVPNACLATGARRCTIFIFGATNLKPIIIYCELTGVDLNDGVRAGMTALPNAAAAASGGLIINGSNSGTVTLAAATITGTFTISDGIVVARSTGNSHAVLVTGSGTGAGLRCVGGAIGNGFAAISSGGSAFVITSTGSSGLVVTANNTGAVGFDISASGLGGIGMRITAFDDALKLNGDSGFDINCVGNGTGTDLSNLSVDSLAVVGAITATSGSNNIVGCDIAKISGDATAADGLEAMLDGTGEVTLTLESIVVNNSGGSAVTLTSGGSNGHGLLLTGNGSGSGLRSVGGLTGNGCTIVGGGTSGRGISITTTDGHGIYSAPGGAGVAALYLTGAGGGSIGAYLSGDNAGLSISGNLELAGLAITGQIQADNASNNIVGVTLASGSIAAATFASAAITSTVVADGFLTAAKVATGAIDADALATDAVTEIANGVNTTLSSSHGSGTWGPFAGSGANAITVTVTDGTDPLQNAIVTLYDGATLAGSLSTDASGNASFSLAVATYTVAIVKANYSFTPTTRTVTGNQAGTLVNDLEMTAGSVITAPSDPSLCRLVGFMRNPHGAVVPNAKVVMRMTSPTAPTDQSVTYQDFIIAGRLVDAETDATGQLDTEILRTDLLDTAGWTWTIECKKAGVTLEGITLTTATKDLKTLL